MSASEWADTSLFRGAFRLRGDTRMREIPLTRGKVAIIDDEDLPLVVGKKWCARCGGRYAGRREGGARNAREIRMHRLILGAGPGVEIDHVNGNGLDNRRCNLRIADRRDNMRNQRMHVDNCSGFKGVSFMGGKHHRHKPWQARIKAKGRDEFLGSFSKPKDAALAYDQAAKELFGRFARTNQMMGLL